MDALINIGFTIMSGIITTVLAYFLKTKIAENKQLKKAMEEEREKRSIAIGKGVLCLLRKDLIDEHAKYTEKGYITSKALESGMEMYHAYKALGGNGMIDHMEEEIRNLPIRN